MKYALRLFVLPALFLILGAQSAKAGYCYPTGGGSGDCVQIGCAPKMVATNVTRTDEILSSLAASNDFANAKQFKIQLRMILGEKQPAVRLQKYMALVGVDATDNKAIAQFVGQRSVPKSQITLLMANAGLNAVQSQQVIESIDHGLRGGLQ